MKKLLFISVLFFSLPFWESWGGASFAQNKKIDSLQMLLKNDKEDTNKVNHSNRLCLRYIDIGLYDTAFYYGNQAMQLAQHLNFKRGIGNSYNDIGIIYFEQSSYSKALISYQKALKINEELKDEYSIAKNYANIGNVYFDQEDYSKALDCFFKSLKIEEKLKHEKEIGLSFNAIGNIYLHQDDYSKALAYYLRGLKIAEKLNDKTGLAIILSNIGTLYIKQKNYAQAQDYYFRSLNVVEKLGNKRGNGIILKSIGSLYAETGKFKEAELYLKNAAAIADSIGDLFDLKEAEESLYKLYDTTGKHQLALIYYKKQVTLGDTILNRENKQEQLREEMNLEFDKKEIRIKAENEKQQAIAEEKKQQQIFIICLVVFSLLVVLVLIGFVFKSLRTTRKQKQIIEIKNTETEHQKKIIEEKNKDITASIQYAKHIQNALLREEAHISMHLPEHFILFLPKDIVSGDFYWGAEKQEYWYFAAADCTGHGVPGAIMSMLGISFLNDIVSSEKLVSPAEILNRLRDRIISELRQTGADGGNKDGMDISLVRLNLKTYELQWAGANNALNLIRNGQLEEVKADKQPIGYYPEMKVFTNHEIQVQKGDSIYIYSDGYADQFGGPKGKKLTYKRLENLLLAQNKLPVKEQKQILKQHFIDWKGSLEQVDDVCVIGVRI